uniref:Uncharacterized protein n=1 Tax=Glossina austeni TaxID=7395 RepID=A0A1A9VYX1_GLOAU
MPTDLLCLAQSDLQLRMCQADHHIALHWTPVGVCYIFPVASFLTSRERMVLWDGLQWDTMSVQSSAAVVSHMSATALCHPFTFRPGIFSSENFVVIASDNLLNV